MLMGPISRGLAVGLVVACILSGVAGFFFGTTQSGSKATSNGTPTGITAVEIYVLQGGTIYLVQSANYSDLQYEWMNCNFLLVCVSGDSVTFTLSAYNNAIGPNNTPTTITISKVDQLSVTSSAASLLSVNPQPPIAFRGVSDSIVFQLDIEVTGSGSLSVYVSAS
jgi:hypothetical protein